MEQDSPPVGTGTPGFGTGTPAPPSSYSTTPAPNLHPAYAPHDSYTSHDSAAGNLPSDTSSYDSKIPEGILKPRDFDTTPYGGDDRKYGTDSTPFGSESTPFKSTPFGGDSYDQAAGTAADDSESKIPQGILAPTPKYDEPKRS